MAAGHILAMKQKMFSTVNYVCGGHGARWPVDQKFKIPKGITVNFYIADLAGLPNRIGQQVDQILKGGTAPTPFETFGPGQECWDYRLFFAKAGGYLSLKMSTTANKNYITTDNKDIGIHLSEIINEHIIPYSPVAAVHWSACRSLESGTDIFSVNKVPLRTGALAKLASQK